MTGTIPKNISPSNESGAPASLPDVPIAEDDVEDGDIATPKRDRSGNDDEPL